MEWTLPRMICYLPTDSYQKILLRCWLNLHRNVGTVCGASTTYLDLTSAFFFNEYAKDLMVSVSHRRTPVIGILVNRAT